MDEKLTLDDEYREMAADEAREREALEWVEAMVAAIDEWWSLEP